eukprot:TRINITY_DN6037_c0_g1_i1.p1 TRINITY_DN6037_c0_g1~~TRINITY_DN6037_c0_g1_i1.p1  ORF type:complete len:103 (-),score=25.30 TRINITY_DN6037_c0_g1_i1:14-322(-)
MKSFLIIFVIYLVFQFVNAQDIEISNIHAHCSSTKDCGTVKTFCSGCECLGKGVNNEYKNYYENLFFSKCSGFSGGVCRMKCPPQEVTCVNGVCEVVNSDTK